MFCRVILFLTYNYSGKSGHANYITSPIQWISLKLDHFPETSATFWGEGPICVCEAAIIWPSKKNLQPLDHQVYFPAPKKMGPI